MPTNPYDPSFWSAPNSMQGSQSMQSSGSASGTTYPFQSQYSSPGPYATAPSSNQTLGQFNTYQDYLRQFQLGNRDNTRSNPYAAQSDRYTSQGAGGRTYYTSRPYTEEQFNQTRVGRNLGTGEQLRTVSTTPALEQYRTQLSQLLKSPTDIANDPNYQFIRDQGYGALSRMLGASRMRDSGAALLEAQKFGQGTASQYLQRLADLYSGGVGTEVAAQQPRLRAEEDIFSRYWGGSPYSFSSSGGSSQSLGFSG